MTETSPARATAVVDANVAVWAVLPVLARIDAVDLFAGWHRQGLRLVAPMLWLAECVSAIRGVVHAGMILPEEGRIAVDDLLALEVALLAMTPPQCRSALEWAQRLGQRQAYDGFYLALAEELGVELHTADQRLVDAAHAAGVTWVRQVG